MPEEVDRGMIHYYHEDDGVNEKVKSYVFTVAESDRRLWGVAECQVQGQLMPEEMNLLMDSVAGQASDGNVKCLLMYSESGEVLRYKHFSTKYFA